jgi:HEAT repeat protein
VKQLERDPEYQARMAEIERRRQVLVAKNIRDAQPLVAQLAALGFEVQSPADLFNKRMNYQAAIPTLIQWLPRISNPAVKADVARALSVKWAKPGATRVLLEEFGRAEDDLLRWAIANALEVVADDSAFTAISSWAIDPQYGSARQMLVLALGHMSNPAAFDVLVRLLGDETVAGHAVISLGNLRDQRARTALEPFLRHPKKWIRDEARKAVKKLGAAGRGP